MLRIAIGVIVLGIGRRRDVRSACVTRIAKVRRGLWTYFIALDGQAPDFAICSLSIVQLGRHGAVPLQGGWCTWGEWTLAKFLPEGVWC